jgi:hypothetical protein
MFFKFFWYAYKMLLSKEVQRYKPGTACVDKIKVITVEISGARHAPGLWDLMIYNDK